jgi:hypothetical protein
VLCATGEGGWMAGTAALRGDAAESTAPISADAPARMPRGSASSRPGCQAEICSARMAVRANASSAWPQLSVEGSVSPSTEGVANQKLVMEDGHCSLSLSPLPNSVKKNLH